VNSDDEELGAFATEGDAVLDRQQLGAVVMLDRRLRPSTSRAAAFCAHCRVAGKPARMALQ